MSPVYRLSLLFIISLLSLQACNLPLNLLPPTPGPLPETEPATATLEAPKATSTVAAPTKTEIPPASTATSTLKPTATLTPTVTSTPNGFPTAQFNGEFPTVTFNINANCRLGPSKNYFARTSFLKNRSTKLEGRNQDGSWFWAKAIEGYCWINVTTLKDPVSYNFLPVVEFPPLPEAPSQLVVTRKDCSGRVIIGLRWSNVNGETSYNLYRNGITLATLKANAVEYTDYPSPAANYLYEIESINEYGVSVRLSRTVAGCGK